MRNLTLAAAITIFLLRPGRAFEVRGYRIEGNTAFCRRRKNSGCLPITSATVDFARIREGLGGLQLLYRDLGFATVSVTLPQQKLTNGIVRVKIIEGKLASDIASRATAYSARQCHARAAEPTDTNILLNTKWFQPELDRANANQDRQIYPVISPGLRTRNQRPDAAKSKTVCRCTDISKSTTSPRPARHCCGWTRRFNTTTSGSAIIRLAFDYNFSPQQMKPGGICRNFTTSRWSPVTAAYYRLPLGIQHRPPAKIRKPAGGFRLQRSQPSIQSPAAGRPA
jgi:hypothetical protein